MSKLKREFFKKDTIKVAQNLLGNFLVRKIGSKKFLAKITETEAYHGFDDLASHASRGKTSRNKVMFGDAGFTYIYLVYGMHNMFNIVCGDKNFPAAVLIRAVEIEGIREDKTNGPGKLTKYFKIDKSLNGEDITKSAEIWIEDRGVKVKKTEIKKAPRIGVSYAKHCADWQWRFYLDR